MSSRHHAVVALDLGSSNGRAIMGILNGDNLTLHEAYRFSHTVTEHDGHLIWDIDRLVAGANKGISIARTQVPVPIESIGVDSWGVDYALLDADDHRVLPVRSYRDGRMTAIRDDYSAALPPRRAFRLTGVQPADINTANQLFADLQAHPELRDTVSRVQLIPDYVSLLLCGEHAYGRSIASTTGLATPGAATWSPEVFDILGIPRHWFSAITKDSVVLGNHIGTDIPVIRPGGHDTACAVHAIPRVTNSTQTEDTLNPNSVFISCGSWTLVGTCIAQPILTEECYKMGFTNEVCINGGIRLLKNITGLWILQDCMRDLERSGHTTDLMGLLNAAKNSPSLGLVFDPNDEVFTGAGEMVKTIHQRMHTLYGKEPETTGQLVRLIFESLAVAHAEAINDVTSLTGKTPEVVNVVGGGSRNDLLCQMTASATGLPVLAGPAEASAAGNILSQFEAIGVLDSREQDAIVRHSFSPLRYEPQGSTRWDVMRARLHETM